MVILNERPFFIVGHPRSGTTLLRLILCSHPHLYIPEETGFLPFLKTDPNSYLTLKGVEKLLARIGKLNYLWRNLVEDTSEFYAGLPDPTLPFVIDALYRLQIPCLESHRWGDKTPLYVQYIPTISEIFPNAQFIHLVRDGRDAALSAQKKWGASSPYMDLYYLLKHWVWNVEAGFNAGRWLGDDRYFQIKYEELVSNPVKSIEKICNFLNEDFELQMLDHTSQANLIDQSLNQDAGIFIPIHEESVGRWKSEMSEFDLKLAEKLAGNCLDQFDYERPRLPDLSFHEHTSLLLKAVKFTFNNTLRSFLYRIGYLTLNRNMRRA